MLDGSITFTAAWAEGEAPSASDFPELLRVRKFEALEPHAEEDCSFGWVPVTDLLSDEFRRAECFADDWALLALRIDRWSLNQKLRKARIQRYERALLEETGRKGLSRTEKGEIAAKVSAEMRRQTLPSTSVIQAAWNTSSGELWVGTTSERGWETFVHLFELTFTGCRVIAETPYITSTLVLSLEDQTALDGVVGGKLERGQGDLVDHIEGKRFLGREFLRFLWWRLAQAQKDEARVEWSWGESTYRLEFGESMLLAGGISHLTARFKGESWQPSPDALAALREGRELQRAHLRFSDEESSYSWSAVVDPAFGEFRGLSLPLVLTADREWFEHAQERIEHIGIFMALWRALFGAFLTLRIGDRWEELEEAVERWSRGEDGWRGIGAELLDYLRRKERREARRRAQEEDEGSEDGGQEADAEAAVTLTGPDGRTSGPISAAEAMDRIAAHIEGRA